ncbi:MAG: pilus assembly protein [Conchiformibius sp.]|nr:pilus assembly protein [Conchiformibius sp.]
MSSAKPAMPHADGKAPGRMVSLRLESKQVIYASYMSFTEHGGVFLPTSDSYQMGEEVLLVLELVTPAKTEKLFVKTNVFWINSNPSAGGRPKGVGLAFSDDENSIKAKAIFEALLSGLINSDHATYTM